ncbi:polynucleotide adenylyltransferase, partial [Patescibacteria group bacterium]|nr:polynucleotide adenylyltransferase [Patescibacteria group bacterium]
MIKKEMPQYVLIGLNSLKTAGFSAFVVGGAVRDHLLGKTPQDWDIATNAKPEEIIKVFDALNMKTLYENEFGTVTIFIQGKALEITTFRVEGNYIDKRHPELVKWTDKIEEDLKRRDFTVNAMAMSDDYKVLDLFDGK